MKKVLFMFLCTCFSSLVFAQTIRQEEAERLQNTALDVVANYIEMLYAIPAEYTSEEEKEKNKSILRQKIATNAQFANDLDPTNSTTKFFKRDQYFDNIYLFYVDGATFSIEDKKVSDVFLNETDKTFFVIVEITRKIMGNYNNAGKSLPVNDTKTLDFYVQVSAGSNQMPICSMTLHNENNSQYKKVPFGNTSLKKP